MTAMAATMAADHEQFLSLYNVTIDDITLVLNLSAQAEQADCYCPSGVREVSAAYRGYHGYVSLVVCAAGILANAINLAVLTRPALATAPVNRLLTGLAAADMLVMAEYAPFAAYLYLSPPRSHFSRAGATFLLAHMHYSQLLHTASICLTLSLAAWRYITVGYPQLAPRLCTASRCWLALLLSLLTPLPLCAPSMLVFSVQETRRRREDGRLASHFHVDLSERARAHNQLLYELNLWLHAVLVKLLPCAILTAISISLMRTLYTAKKRKKQLTGLSGAQPKALVCKAFGQQGSAKGSAKGALVAGAQGQATARRSRAEKRADRTTRMLLAVLLLFLATEFPQGVLGLMSGVLGRCFFRRCYQLFGEALDILALLNGAINFILYCAMSRQYRQTFRQLFSPAWSWAFALAPWCRRKASPAAPAAPAALAALAASPGRSGQTNGAPSERPAAARALTSGSGSGIAACTTSANGCAVSAAAADAAGNKDGVAAAVGAAPPVLAGNGGHATAL